MNQDLLEFLDANNYVLGSIIQRATQDYGLTEAEIIGGLMIVHNRVKQGEYMKPLLIMREVYSEARLLKAKKYAPNIRELVTMQDKIRQLEGELQAKENPWASLFFPRPRYLQMSVVGSAIFAVLAAIAWVILEA